MGNKTNMSFIQKSKQPNRSAFLGSPVASLQLQNAQVNKSIRKQALNILWGVFVNY